MRKPSSFEWWLRQPVMVRCQVFTPIRDVTYRGWAFLGSLRDSYRGHDDRYRGQASLTIAWPGVDPSVSFVHSLGHVSDPKCAFYWWYPDEDEKWPSDVFEVDWLGEP